MRFAIILFVSGLILTAFGLVMLLVAGIDAVYGGYAAWAFVQSALFTIFIGVAMAVNCYRSWRTLSHKEAFLLTSSVWFLAVLFCALPFYLALPNVDFSTVFFESMSGLTSTGATALVGLDRLPKGILVWRSVLQWIGGIGIVLMAIALLPMLRVGGMQLFLAESSAQIEGDAPRSLRKIITAILLIYVALSILCALCLYFAGMSGFDAVMHAMTCVATGGFSTHDASITYFNSPLIEWILVVFMLAGALPFLAYYYVARGYPKRFMNDTQIKTFLMIVAVVALLMVAWLVLKYGFNDIESLLRNAVFSVVSVITTTGYVTSDYANWGSFALFVFLFLGVIGGCSGSSAGGCKVFRFDILLSNATRYLKHIIYPEGMFAPRYGGQPIHADVMRGVVVFMTMFAMITVFLALILAWIGLDFVTALSGAVAAITNVGPGLGDEIGPKGNFATIPSAAKWFLAFGMMLGRLEFMTVMVLFMPWVWKRKVL